MNTLRLPDTGRYWIKQARVVCARLVGVADTPAAERDGTVLVDIRVEDGRIRAVFPVGTAPCCCPGLSAAGAPVEAACRDGVMAVDGPADLILHLPSGIVRLKNGALIAATARNI